jgi:DNA-binding ferritin-like protein (Dps family)
LKKEIETLNESNSDENFDERIQILNKQINEVYKSIDEYKKQIKHTMTTKIVQVLMLDEESDKIFTCLDMTQMAPS